MVQGYVFRDMLKALLRVLLKILDTFGAFVGALAGEVADMIRNMACVGCSLTGIAVGVLSDFVDDFPVTIPLQNKPPKSECALHSEAGGEVFSLLLDRSPCAPQSWTRAVPNATPGAWVQRTLEELSLATFSRW